MSVLANTLNAYAARLKAQRRAQERDAIRAARTKSQAQREAEQAQREAIRAQKNVKPQQTNKQAVAFYLDNVVREMKRLYGYEMATGERARATRDILSIVDVYHYSGILTCSVYKKIDLSGYSTTGFEIIMSVLASMKILSADGAHRALVNKTRSLVVHLTPGGVGQAVASIGLSQATTDINEITDMIHQRIAEYKAA
jgi:hypothetical protein